SQFASISCLDSPRWRLTNLRSGIPPNTDNLETPIFRVTSQSPEAHTKPIRKPQEGSFERAARTFSSETQRYGTARGIVSSVVRNMYGNSSDSISMSYEIVDSSASSRCSSSKFRRERDSGASG